MEYYWNSLQSSMQDLAQNPSLPIFVAAFTGISIACFAVGILYMLRKTPLRRPVKQPQSSARGFGKLASSV